MSTISQKSTFSTDRRSLTFECDANIMEIFEKIAIALGAEEDENTPHYFHINDDTSWHDYNDEENSEIAEFVLKTLEMIWGFHNVAPLSLVFETGYSSLEFESVDGRFAQLVINFVFSNFKNEELIISHSGDFEREFNYESTTN